MPLDITVCILPFSGHLTCMIFVKTQVWVRTVASFGYSCVGCIIIGKGFDYVRDVDIILLQSFWLIRMNLVL